MCVCVVGSLVAQWLARCAATPEVGGSNPTRGKKVYAIFATSTPYVPPVHPAVMGTQPVWGANSLAMPHWSATGPGGTSGAHTH